MGWYTQSENSMAMYGLAAKSLSRAISLNEIILEYCMEALQGKMTVFLGHHCIHLPEQLTINVLGQLTAINLCAAWSRKAIPHRSYLVFIVLIIYSQSW